MTELFPLNNIKCKRGVSYTCEVWTKELTCSSNLGIKTCSAENRASLSPPSAEGHLLSNRSTKSSSQLDTNTVHELRSVSQSKSYSGKIIFGDSADLCTATPSLLLRFIEPYIRGRIVDVLVVIRSSSLCCKFSSC